MNMQRSSFAFPVKTHWIHPWKNHGTR